MPQAEVSTPAAATVDMMNQLAGLSPTSATAAMRALRPDVVRHSQGSYDTLVAPATATGLTLVERAQVALRVAVQTDSLPLIAHYRQRLTELGAPEESMVALEQRASVGMLDQRTSAIMRHVDLLTQTPGQATPSDLNQLQTSGLSGAEIVTLAQLIAFLSFQVRVLPVLCVLGEGEAA